MRIKPCVTLALGSSLGNKTEILTKSKHFLAGLSSDGIVHSSIWETEPVGIASKPFYNSVVQIYYEGTAESLFKLIKSFESDSGRDLQAPRWSDRLIDIDIIDYYGKMIVTPDLEIPHPRYTHRLFVLHPLQEIDREWTDPLSGDHISDLIKKATPIQLSKKSVKW
jgi:2-amino-4-hydroxy-6-hydroxymethyldihydropteridine diphosphokinase